MTTIQDLITLLSPVVNVSHIQFTNVEKDVEEDALFGSETHYLVAKNRPKDYSED